MVRPTPLVLIALALLRPSPHSGAAEGAAAPDVDRAIGRALGQARLPWYDPGKDAARPIRVPGPSGEASSGASGRSWRDWGSSSSGSNPSPPGSSGRSGGVAGLIWFGLGLFALVGVLSWLYRRFDPFAGVDAPPNRLEPGPGVVDVPPGGLPVGFDSADPWAEASRRRAAGDLSGAIICLFAHQMLTLSRLGLVRLAPGRTGRQLVRAVTDADLRGLVRPTLGLFEATYYGRIAPDPEAFVAAWARAEAFERLVTARGPG